VPSEDADGERGTARMTAESCRFADGVHDRGGEPVDIIDRRLIRRDFVRGGFS